VLTGLLRRGRRVERLRVGDHRVAHPVGHG
jgi:hypothetical protein